jgi:hypothetical protein
MTTSEETNIDTKLALISQDVGYVKQELRTLTSSYATNARADNLERRIALVEKAVFSVIGLIVLAVLGAVVNGQLK